MFYKVLSDNSTHWNEMLLNENYSLFCYCCCCCCCIHCTCTLPDAALSLDPSREPMLEFLEWIVISTALSICKNLSIFCYILFRHLWLVSTNQISVRNASGLLFIGKTREAHTCWKECHLSLKGRLFSIRFSLQGTSFRILYNHNKLYRITGKKKKKKSLELWYVWRISNTVQSIILLD